MPGEAGLIINNTISQQSPPRFIAQGKLMAYPESVELIVGRHAHTVALRRTVRVIESLPRVSKSRTGLALMGR